MDDLDKVARSLASPEASDDSTLTTRLDRWLAGLVNRRGSDLLLVEGAPPCIRVDGTTKLRAWQGLGFQHSWQD